MKIQFLRGLATCERQGGWGKAFWWVRMAAWYILWPRENPKYTLAS
jgi:hypothetical protein